MHSKFIKLFIWTSDYEDKIRKFEKQETENKDRDIALLRKLNSWYLIWCIRFII